MNDSGKKNRFGNNYLKTFFLLENAFWVWKIVLLGNFGHASNDCKAFFYCDQIILRLHIELSTMKATYYKDER